MKKKIDSISMQRQFFFQKADLVSGTLKNPFKNTRYAYNSSFKSYIIPCKTYEQQLWNPA